MVQSNHITYMRAEKRGKTLDHEMLLFYHQKNMNSKTRRSICSTEKCRALKLMRGNHASF